MEDIPGILGMSADKGAVVFQMLRSTRVTRSFRPLKNFMQQYAGNRDDGGFPQSGRGGDGEELRISSFSGWNRTGAEFKLDYTIFPHAEGFRVTGKITQDLTRSGCRLTFI